MHPTRRASRWSTWWRSRSRSDAGGQPGAPPAGLTPRQVEVLDLLTAGATNAEIAETLVIAPKTVDPHVSAVLQKLGVASRRGAAAAAARLAAAP